jgi:serine/threonine protein kinase
MSTSPSPRRFQFLREIASGGFGSVYLAKVIHADGFNRLVAVKLLHKRWSENDEIASRMRDEARLLGWLRHRNIVEVLDLTFIDGRSAVVMEYLEAIDAKGLVDRCVAQRTDIPLPVVCEFGAATASALDAAYNRPPYAGEKPLRVIHRDIKPSNLMLDSHGTVKVLDFGVARAEFDTREAKTAELSFGSLEYMPPERLFFEPESPASDVYSLGSTLYELLALEKLGKARLRQSEQDRFVQERLQALFQRRPLEPVVRRELEPLLTRMLAFDESDRPTSAELTTKLRAIARSSSEPALEDWSAKHVLVLLDAVRANDRPAGDGGTMLGQTVFEDATTGSEATRRQDPEETTGTATEVFHALDLDGPESAEYTTSTGHDEARWSALKEATLASLNETGELSKAILPPSLSGRSADATLPSRGTPKPAASRERPTLAPPSRPPEVGSLADLSADEETLADGAPTVADLRRTGNRAPPPAVTQRIAVNRKESPSQRPTSGKPPPAPPQAPRQGSKLPPVSARPPPPPIEEEPGILSVELVMATGAVGAAGIGTFLFVLAVGVPTVAVLLGLWPMGPPSPPPPLPVPPPLTAPGPAPVEPAPAEPAPVEPGPAEPAPVEPAPAEPAPGSAAKGLSFVSEMPQTRKMTVRCDTGSGQGEGSVELGEVAPKECTVVAIDESRKRRTAVVKSPKATTWRCFAGDADTCEPGSR